MEKLPMRTAAHCERSNFVTWKIPSSGSTKMVEANKMNETRIDQLKVLDLNGQTVRSD